MASIPSDADQKDKEGGNTVAMSLLRCVVNATALSVGHAGVLSDRRCRRESRRCRRESVPASSPQAFRVWES